MAIRMARGREGGEYISQAFGSPPSGSPERARSCPARGLPGCGTRGAKSHVLVVIVHHQFPRPARQVDDAPFEGPLTGN
jgi:hypothetical protein